MRWGKHLSIGTINFIRWSFLFYMYNTNLYFVIYIEAHYVRWTVRHDLLHIHQIEEEEETKKGTTFELYIHRIYENKNKIRRKQSESESNESGRKKNSIRFCLVSVFYFCSFSFVISLFFLLHSRTLSAFLFCSLSYKLHIKYSKYKIFLSNKHTLVFTFHFISLTLSLLMRLFCLQVIFLE